jgi:hypothetical protein
MTISIGDTTFSSYDIYMPELSDVANIQDALKLYHFGSSKTQTTNKGIHGLLINMTENPSIYGSLTVKTGTLASPGTQIFKIDTTIPSVTIAGALTVTTAKITGDVVGDVYASNGTSKILESGTNGTDASVTASLTGDVYASNGTSKILENGTDGTNASFIGNVTGNTVGKVTVEKASANNVGKVFVVDPSVTVSTNGTLGTRSGSGPYTTTITLSGTYDTSSINPGAVGSTVNGAPATTITATGLAGTTTVTAKTSNTITISSTNAFVSGGAVTNIVTTNNQPLNPVDGDLWFW